MNITRKEFLSTGAKYAAGAVAGVGAVNLLARSTGMAGIQTAWPYPYQALDVEKVRKYEHDLYYSKGCSYGSFHALVKAASELIGEPWTSFPSEIMVYGKGGSGLGDSLRGSKWTGGIHFPCVPDDGQGRCSRKRGVRLVHTDKSPNRHE